MPAIFLVAVIVLVVLVVQSGMLGGDDSTPTPQATATKTKSGGTSQSGTTKYKVKSGDSLSSIAVKFDTTVSAIEDLNPDLTTSLTVGQTILVPSGE